MALDLNALKDMFLSADMNDIKLAEHMVYQEMQNINVETSYEEILNLYRLMNALQQLGVPLTNGDYFEKHRIFSNLKMFLEKKVQENWATNRKS